MELTLRKRHVWLVILIFSVLIALHYGGILQPVEHAITRVINPSIRTIAEVGARLGSLKTYFTDKATLVTRIEQLEDAATRQRLDSAERTLLQEENNALREQLKFTQRTRRIPLISYVVGKTIDNTANTITIDRGSADGVALENAVIVGDGVLVGKIAKVTPHSAIVRLMNDPRSKIAVTILNKDKSIGLVEGGFGISVKLTTVLQNETITEGDSIVTSGLEETVPRGLLIGTIATVQKETHQPFQEATIIPAAPFGRLTIVGVLRP